LGWPVALADGPALRTGRVPRGRSAAHLPRGHRVL